MVKIWDTSVKCSYAAVKFLNAYISVVSRQKKHSYLEQVYVHAIFILVHGHLCFINKLKGFFRCKAHLVVAMIILHSAVPSRVHICIAVFIDRSVFLSV